MTFSDLKHILLADDDKDDWYLFKDVLEELSPAVRLECVANGDELFQSLTDATVPLPGIIVLDVNMPRRSGIDCLKQLKSDDRWREIPVIMLSTTTQESAVDQVYDLGARLFVQKANTISEFRIIVKKILDTASETDRPSKSDFLLKL